MPYFLRCVAQSLHRRYGEEVSSLKILFPNRRTQVFFDRELSRLAERPLWQPEYLNLEGIFQKAAGLDALQTPRLVGELYKVYSRFHEQSFDAFYFWGELLIRDFDAVDHYLASADMLFSNLSGLKELEADWSFLTPEQLAVISRFWQSIGMEGEFSPEKRRFVELWKTLGPIYHALRENLLKMNAGYGGMIARRAVERIEAGEVEPMQGPVIIVGFNALTECERRLFRHLKNASGAEFFWDADSYYLDDPVQEAGRFLREDISDFPPAEIFPELADRIAARKEAVVVPCPSDSLQSKYVGHFLEEVREKQGEVGAETAIVLLDEGLLLPVLYSLPGWVDHLNVTMGYPLRQTLAYSLIERLLSLHGRGRHKAGAEAFHRADVIGVLGHPLLKKMVPAGLAEEVRKRERLYIEAEWLGRDELTRALFRSPEGWQGLSGWLLDILGRCVQGEVPKREKELVWAVSDLLTATGNVLAQCGIEMTGKIYTALIRRALRAGRVPFTGEPLSGLQVMGILETRNLDFDNVLMLGLSDDVFPSGSSQPSFIPYNLRLAYGLPVVEHNEGVSAYYFYRMLQGAQKVHMCYCSQPDEGRTGEPSRFIHQLKYEAPFPVTWREVKLEASLEVPQPLVIEKTGRVKEALDRMLAGEMTLSPTALAKYLACPMMFYLGTVAKIRPREEVTEEVDPSLLGSILHYAMKELYAPLVGVDRPSAAIRALIGSEQVEQAIDQALRKEYFENKPVAVEEYGGNVVMIRDVVGKYINLCLLPYDADRGDFTITGLEQEVKAEFEFADGKSLVFKGICDRVEVGGDGMMRVVDYKTGAVHNEFKDIDSLFDSGDVFLGAVTQILTYCMMLGGREKGIAPALYYIRQLNGQDYSPLLKDKGAKREVEDYGEYAERFEGRLKEALAGLMELSVPFRQCERVETCKNCDYKVLCGRN